MPRINKGQKGSALGKLIGANIKAARLRRGMTQSALAEALSLETVTISRVETGAQLPSIDRLSDIADYLGTSLRLLVSDMMESDAFGERIAEVAGDLPSKEKDFVYSLVNQFAQYWRDSAKIR